MRTRSTASSDTHARLSEIVASHQGSLMRIARSITGSNDDASDACQRGFETYLRCAHRLDRQTEVAWLHTVVRNEAIAISKESRRSAGSVVIEPQTEPESDSIALEDRVIDRERMSRSTEALRRLRPDQARALMLKAHGYSYKEIGAQLNWTYTKVNRCVTEGRKEFFSIYNRIEAGDQCAVYAPTLRRLAEGSVGSDELVELRPHLRHCAACRASVRDMHVSLARRARLLFPLPLPVLAQWGGRGDSSVSIPDAIPNLYDAVEAIAPRPARFYELAARFMTPDVATAAQLSAGAHGGGGKIAALATVAGLCVTSAGAGTVSVVTGVIDNPLSRTDKQKPQAANVAAAPPVTKVAPNVAPKLPPSAGKAIGAQLTNTIKRSTMSTRRATEQTARSTQPAAPPSPAQTPPKDHTPAIISPPPAGATQDFSPELSAPTSPAIPSAAPENGGDEFAP